MPRSSKTKGKSPASKARAPATLRSTSGAGFDFEDQISAWQMVKMLCGEEMAGPGGAMTKLQAQVSALGWKIDDLLLTAEVGGIAKRLAISAKGNTQVSAVGLPEDFVRRAWDQWKDPEGPFQRERDGLALVTRGLHPDFDPTWYEVKNACTGADVALALSRIRSSRKQSRVFDSVKAPGGVPVASDAETVQIIRCISVIPLDFQLDRSEAKSQAIAGCRRLLSSGDAAEASALWDYLVKSAKDVRLELGTITVPEIWSQLRAAFSLRHHPDFQSDWEMLTAITEDRRSRVETELPTGYYVPRSEERASIQAAIEECSITILFGDSGSGKSALVKSVLDTSFAALKQVWFGPDELKLAMSVARRSQLPLLHDLSMVLNATVQQRNVLVIDSAERIEASEYSVLRRLFGAILEDDRSGNAGTWRVVIITQPQSLAETEASMVNGRKVRLAEVGPLTKKQVKEALLSSASLAWVSGHEETVAALTNLRTLGWAVKAGSAGLQRNAGESTTHIDIADQLWRLWTDDRADVQRLVMQLATREAAFERSFALTDLEAGDVSTFTTRPPELPLRKNNRTNRIEFEHDLAADWARFQFLKQISHETRRWAELSRNPLWINAIRMLGQFLLRQGSETETEWDVAYRAAEIAKNDLAADILLDAICLDPDAETFLTERAELLLENGAKRFNRLLVRFHHIATVPSVTATSDNVLSLHMESRFRSIVFARWPGMLRFLSSHRMRLNGVVSSELAKVIQTWLNGTPKTFLDGSPIPFRREMAEIALDMARTVQVEKAQGVLYISRETLLYTAPLAAAMDAPVEIGEWALELAGRRPVAPDIGARIAEAKRKKAESDAERLKTDPAYSARYEKRRHASRSIPSFRRALAPWPLGASTRVDHDFKNACFNEGGLNWLMRAQPTVASEVLLALIIEDQPYEDGDSRYEIDLGLQFAREAYPTAFWKSPFFPFLQITPDVALDTLLQLVEFCTERWCASTRDAEQYVVTLSINGTNKRFEGGFPVFDWVQTDSLHHGNLHCSLDALERWLTQRLEKGENIDSDIEKVLRESHSTALISVMVNVAKYQPSLLNGALAPLLSSPEIIRWDGSRVSQIGQRFAAMSWVRQGEVVFDFARKWVIAPHRSVRLLDVVVNLFLADDDFAASLDLQVADWIIPKSPKASLETKLISAQLNRANYVLSRDPQTGIESLQVAIPQAIVDEVAAWQNDKLRPLTNLTLPDRCEEWLQGEAMLTDEAANFLATELSKNEDAQQDGDLFAPTAKLAAAAVLIVRGAEWMKRNPDFCSASIEIIRHAVAEVPATGDEVRGARIHGHHDGLRFVSHAVMHLWMSGDPLTEEWERAVVRLLTSGDKQAAGTIVQIAYKDRTKLGSAWWRLISLGVLWSGLALLAPRDGYNRADDDVGPWPRWVARLRGYPLRGIAATPDDIDLHRVAMACGRLDYQRRVREYAAGDRRWLGKPNRNRHFELDTDFLDALFGWLLRDAGSGDAALDRSLTLQIWEFDAARAKSHLKDHGEYDLPSQSLGYNVLAKVAELCLTAPKEEQRTVWEAVLKHAPEAHVAVEHFISAFFHRLGNGVCDPAAFEHAWRSMIEYGLSAAWNKEGLWFYGERLIGDLLGFGNATILQRLAPDVILRMRDVYKRWAKEHLAVDDEAVTRFSRFLVTPFGSGLRLDGLQWLYAALCDQGEHFYRDDTGTALVELLAQSLQTDASLLAKNREATEALIGISAALVSKNVPAALALQERIRQLR